MRRTPDPDTLASFDCSYVATAGTISTVDSARAALKLLDRQLRRLVVTDLMADDLRGMALYHAGMIEEALEDMGAVEGQG